MPTEKARDHGVPRHARPIPRHLGPLRALTFVLVAVLASSSGIAYGLVHHFQHNVDTYDVGFLMHGDDDPKTPKNPEDEAAGKSLNILVLGSDWRGGDNGSVAKDGAKEGNAQRSDTAMVMHISSDRKRIDVVSIPRDSRVDVPACQLDSAGKVWTGAGGTTMFNNAFAYGWDTAQSHGWDESKSFGAAAACAWQTVEHLTGITLSGYVVVDFSGFEGMINALGGVDVCAPTDVDDSKSGLHITAGWHNLKGKTAIAWARSRHGQADGSDIARIGRQQALVGSIANKFFAQNYVTSTPKLVEFVDAATKSMHTSKNVGSLTYLAGLGFSLRNLDMANVTFRTVPFFYYPKGPNYGRVGWQTEEAAALWAKIKKDKPLGDVEKTTGSTGTSTGKSTSSGKSTSGTGSTSSPTKKASTTKKVVTGMENSPLSAGDLPTTKAECNAALKAANK